MAKIQVVPEARTVPNNRSAPAKEREFEERISNFIHAESLAITGRLMMELLLPIGRNATHDDALIAITLAAEGFVHPLTHNEVTVLACVLYMGHVGRSADYSDVLNLTYRFRKKRMNATTVYNTFRALVDRGLIEDKGRLIDDEGDRPSRAFTINDLGKEAFRLAVLNYQRLSSFQNSDAA